MLTAGPDRPPTRPAGAPTAPRCARPAAVNRDGSAICLAAFCLAGRPPGYGGDRRVGLMQRLRCPGGWITAPGGQRQAMHERPGQRQGDSQQQPHPQAPGEKCPHAQVPSSSPVRCSGALPPLSRANHVPSRLLLQSGMVTQVGELGVGFQNAPGGTGRRRAGCRGARYAVAVRPARSELACHRRAAAAVSQAALAEVLGLRLAKYWPVMPST